MARNTTGTGSSLSLQPRRHTGECRYPAVFHRDSEKPFEQVMRRIATRISVINADNRFAHAENSGHYIRIICGYYLYDAIEAAQDTLAAILGKARFWERFAKEPLNERQIKILNSLLDGFEGKLTTSKWAKVTKCSQDTAYRDILDLIDRGALQKDAGGGRSTSYSLVNK